MASGFDLHLFGMARQPPLRSPTGSRSITSCSRQSHSRSQCTRPPHGGPFASAHGTRCARHNVFSTVVSVKFLSATTSRLGRISADRRHPEVSADLPRELVAVLRVAGVLPHQGAAVRPEVREQSPTIHTVTFSSWYPSCASRSAASRLSWIASPSVTCSVSSSSSRLSAWQLTPGTSSIHPIQNFPSCLMMAVVVNAGSQHAAWELS
jgi:hypothetical protein